MNRLAFLVLALIFALVVVGCNGKGKDAELISTGGSVGSGTSGSTENPSTPGATTGTEGTTPGSGAIGATTGSPTSGSGMAPTENSSIDSSGAMIKHEEGKPAPEGQVWCENCKGHLPKEDAVTSADGKAYCMACAEELKIKN
ncbi:MAG: hypothetical protein ACKVQS_06165 [Fimbriimonadaceae bacterium]